MWALKLMEDMPQIFDRIEFSTTVKPGFDVYLLDDIHDQKPSGLVVHFKSNLTPTNLLLDTHVNTSQQQSMSELELLAKSGFLSIVGLSRIPHGEAKKVFSLPQQPTNNLMFYYVHSLMAVTQVLLNLGKKDLLIENVASENLLYLC